MNIGPAEILVILVVALLVFGPQRLPEVGRQVGAAVRELRKMQDAVRGELDMVLNPEHGTSPRDAPPLEPADHGAIDETVDVNSVEVVQPTDDPADDDPETPFSGPPGSFI